MNLNPGRERSNEWESLSRAIYRKGRRESFVPQLCARIKNIRDGNCSWGEKRAPRPREDRAAVIGKELVTVARRRPRPHRVS